MLSWTVIYGIGHAKYSVIYTRQKNIYPLRMEHPQNIIMHMQDNPINLPHSIDLQYLKSFGKFHTIQIYLQLLLFLLIFRRLQSISMASKNMHKDWAFVIIAR